MTPFPSLDLRSTPLKRSSSLIMVLRVFPSLWPFNLCRCWQKDDARHFVSGEGVFFHFYFLSSMMRKTCTTRSQINTGFSSLTRPNGQANIQKLTTQDKNHRLSLFHNTCKSGKISTTDDSQEQRTDQCSFSNRNLTWRFNDALNDPFFFSRNWNTGILDQSRILPAVLSNSYWFAQGGPGLTV